MKIKLETRCIGNNTCNYYQLITDVNQIETNVNKIPDDALAIVDEIEFNEGDIIFENRPYFHNSKWYEVFIYQVINSKLELLTNHEWSNSAQNYTIRCIKNLFEGKSINARPLEDNIKLLEQFSSLELHHELKRRGGE